MPGTKTNRRKAHVPWGWILASGLAAAALILFYALRTVPGFADGFSARVSAPLRRALGAVSAPVPFSVMEFLYAAGVILLLSFLALTVRRVLVSRGRRLAVLGRRVLALALAAVYIWLGYCWLWGIDYYAADFRTRSGLKADGASVEELTAVTAYFAAQANEWAPQVRRDAGGHYAEDLDALFAGYDGLYDLIEADFPFLSGVSRRPKQMVFSRIMSYMGFTGIYFPFTGESNINTDPPAATMPATIAHELAHQRGVAKEQEANFVGILACARSADPAYRYAGYLLGLTYLSNALYQASPGAWAELSVELCAEIRTDWQDSNDYWAALQTPVREVSEKVYDGYLKAQGQDLGIRSYGACVDLLVAYFLPEAA